MTDSDCVEFLQWALPRLGLRWYGYRKVRRQVCRRVERRLRTLALPDVHAYRAYLSETPGEWRDLDRLCVITISRFYRDRGVFEYLGGTVLPALAERVATGRRPMKAWSAGCASGEEAYSLVLVWHYAVQSRFPDVTLSVLATDVDETMLRRASQARYGASSVRDIPDAWRKEAFGREGDGYRLRRAFRQPVTYVRHDVRDPVPDGPFDLVLCRNLAFTYFDADVQRDVAARLEACLRPGGALVIGSHESLPDESGALEPWEPGLPVYRRAG